MTSNSIISQIHESLNREIHLQIERQIMDRLAQIGLQFGSSEHFHSWAKDRLTLVHLDDVRRELYLDYKSEKEILVASWNHKFEIDFEVNQNNQATTVKATYNPP